MPRLTITIRNAVKTIITNLALVELKQVYSARVMNLDYNNQVPCAMVYFDDGTIDTAYMDGTKEIDAILNIEVIASDNFNVDEKLDSFALLLETEFEKHPTLSGLVKQFTYKSFGYTRDDKTALATITLTYRILYTQP